MKVRSSMVAIILAAALGIAWMPAATAQVPGPSLLQSPPTYSDDELKLFAAAAIEVQRISDDYLPRLQAAQTAEEEQDVQRVAAGKMTEAVKSKGMTVDKFNEIMVVAQIRPEVANRIVQHINEQQ